MKLLDEAYVGFIFTLNEQIYVVLQPNSFKDGMNHRILNLQTQKITKCSFDDIQYFCFNWPFLTMEKYNER